MRVRSRESQVVPDVPLVAWAQPGWPGQTPPGEPPVERDAEPYYPPPPAIGPALDYAERESWPGPLAAVVGESPTAGVRLVRVRVSPVEWRPREEALVLHAALDVEVVYRGGGRIVAHNYGEAEVLAGLRHRVENPDAIAPARPVPPRQISSAPYLIVTDNHRWVPGLFAPDLPVGDMVSEFQRLADWKTKKGLKAEVVTLSDIAAGVYGDFTTDTADVPEMVRKFLKHAHASWNTYWVLLGGDDSILPPRFVVVNTPDRADRWQYRWNPFSAVVAGLKPKVEECSWDGSQARLHQDPKIIAIGPGHRIFAGTSGAAFEYNPSASSSSPGWAYATSDDYQTLTTVPTEWIVVRGASALLAGTDLYADLQSNSIPTDAYFASLRRPAWLAVAGLSGARDWDANGNGAYGQYSKAGDLDGVSYTLDLALGRAPARSAMEARYFVDKVLAYERYEDKGQGYGQRLLLGSSSWGGRPEVTPQVDKDNVMVRPSDGVPLEVYRFQRERDGVAYVMDFGAPPTTDTINWRLYRDADGVPYTRAPQAGQLGYFFCTDASCARVSEALVKSTWVPQPTRFVAVKSPKTPGIPASFYFDQVGVDGSAIEKEQVRGLLGLRAPRWSRRLRLYEEAASLPAAPDLALNTRWSMAAALQQGFNVVSLSGHGLASGCCRVSSQLLQQYGTLDVNGFVYADSCLTNEFDVDAISEQIVRSEKGAAAYLGNSRYSWIGRGAELERLFWDDVDRDPRIGWLHNSRELLVHDPYYRWSFFSLNLEGDPEMGLWQGEPVRGVARSTVVPGDTAMTVSVLSDAGAALAGVRVALTDGRGIVDVQDTNADGTARLRLRGRPGRAVTLVATGRGLLPLEQTIEIPRRPRRNDAEAPAGATEVGQ